VDYWGFVQVLSLFPPDAAQLLSNQCQVTECWLRSLLVVGKKFVSEHFASLLQSKQSRNQLIYL
jgi:hypothetical protein